MAFLLFVYRLWVLDTDGHLRINLESPRESKRNACGQQHADSSSATDKPFPRGYAVDCFSDRARNPIAPPVLVRSI